MSISEIALLTTLLLFVLFAIGFEISLAMALAGFVGFAAIVNAKAAFFLVAKDVFSVFSSYGFTVIPLFVLMGQLGASGGVARSLYDCSYKWIGHVTGGLAIGTVAVLILTLIKRDMDLKRFVAAVHDTLRIGCMVMMLLAGATILGHFFAVTRAPFIVAGWLESLNVSPFVVMLII